MENKETQARSTSSMPPSNASVGEYCSDKKCISFCADDFYGRPNKSTTEEEVLPIAQFVMRVALNQSPDSSDCTKSQSWPVPFV
jgi:hypothetical protein